MRVIEEVAADTYKATPLSEALTIPKYRDAIPFWYVSVHCVSILAKIIQFRSSWTDFSEATGVSRQYKIQRAFR